MPNLNEHNCNLSPSHYRKDEMKDRGLDKQQYLDSLTSESTVFLNMEPEKNPNPWFAQLYMSSRYVYNLFFS